MYWNICQQLSVLTLNIKIVRYFEVGKDHYKLTKYQFHLQHVLTILSVFIWYFKIFETSRDFLTSILGYYCLFTRHKMHSILSMSGQLTNISPTFYITMLHPNLLVLLAFHLPWTSVWWPISFNYGENSICMGSSSHDPSWNTDGKWLGERSKLASSMNCLSMRSVSRSKCCCKAASRNSESEEKTNSLKQETVRGKLKA